MFPLEAPVYTVGVCLCVPDKSADTRVSLHSRGCPWEEQSLPGLLPLLWNVWHVLHIQEARTDDCCVDGRVRGWSSQYWVLPGTLRALNVGEVHGWS